MPLTIPPSDKIEALIRDITAAEIMPRFQTLSHNEKWEKRPGSIVTAADVAAEAFASAENPAAALASREGRERAILDAARTNPLAMRVAAFASK